MSSLSNDYFYTDVMYSYDQALLGFLLITCKSTDYTVVLHSIYATISYTSTRLGSLLLS